MKVITAGLLLTLGVVYTFAVEPVAHEVVALHLPGMTEPIIDDLSYYSDNEWLLIGEGGYLNMHDYNTGLHLTRLEEGAVCYIYPTHAKLSQGLKVKAALERGVTDFYNVTIGTFKQLSLNILETSFVPPASASYCEAGYRWAEVTDFIIDPSNHIHISYAEQRKAAEEATKVLRMSSKSEAAVQARGLRNRRGAAGESVLSGGWTCLSDCNCNGCD